MARRGIVKAIVLRQDGVRACHKVRVKSPIPETTSSMLVTALELRVRHPLIQRESRDATDHRERHEAQIVHRKSGTRVLPMQAHDVDDLHDENERLIHRALRELVPAAQRAPDRDGRSRQSSETSGQAAERTGDAMIQDITPDPSGGTGISASGFGHPTCLNNPTPAQAGAAIIGN